MRVLFLADVESQKYWDFFDKSDFKDIDLIISCGDLKPDYLTYLTTMTGLEIAYVHGNHDKRYKESPPEGCICIEDRIFTYHGIRFLGLGGSMRYKPGEHQYTEEEMRKRIKKLKHTKGFKKGFDVLVTHSPARGLNDGEDLCHIGFECFNELIEKYEPKYFVHGHVHMNYGRNVPRTTQVGNTTVVNAYEKYILDIDIDENRPKRFFEKN